MTLSLLSRTVFPVGIETIPSLVIPTISVSFGNSQSLILLSTRIEFSFILYSNNLALSFAKFSTSIASDTVIILNISWVKSSSGQIISSI